MPVNLALGHVSNAFLIAALVLYSLSVVAFAGDFAFGRPRRAAATARGQQAQDRAAALAAVGVVGSTGPRRFPTAPVGPRRSRGSGGFPGLRRTGPRAAPTRCPSWRFPRCAPSVRPAAGS